MNVQPALRGFCLNKADLMLLIQQDLQVNAPLPLSRPIDLPPRNLWRCLSFPASTHKVAFMRPSTRFVVFSYLIKQRKLQSQVATYLR